MPKMTDFSLQLLLGIQTGTTTSGALSTPTAAAAGCEVALGEDLGEDVSK